VNYLLVLILGLIVLSGRTAKKSGELAGQPFGELSTIKDIQVSDSRNLLDQLKGIGPTSLQQFADYRAYHGGICEPEDLRKISPTWNKQYWNYIHQLDSHSFGTGFVFFWNEFNLKQANINTVDQTYLHVQLKIPLNACEALLKKRKKLGLFSTWAEVQSVAGIQPYYTALKANLDLFVPEHFKLDLNTSSIDELTSQLRLSSCQKKALSAYYRYVGCFDSVPELEYVKCFSRYDVLEYRKKIKVSGACAKKKIFVNRVSLVELQEHPYLTAAQAKQIIQYRERNGPYQYHYQIDELKGIGEKTMNKLYPLLDFSN
jgi:competence protein ComEA